MSTITDPTVATSVIEQAQAGGAYRGEMPADDASKLKVADDLYELAKQARDAGVAGGPVAAVLALVEGGAPQQAAPAAAPAAAAPPAAPVASGKVTIVDQAGTEYEIDAADVNTYVNGSGQYSLKQEAPAPVAPPVAPPQAPVPAQEPVQETAPALTDINQVIPGFDDLKVTDVLTAMEGLDDNAIAFVKAYESQEGERAKIMNFERHQMVTPPAQTAPAAAPPVAASPQGAGQSGVPAVDPSTYASVEPWAGYSKAKISDITDNIDRVLREHPDDAKRVLAHVWEYEKNGKERTRLLNKLQEIAQSLNNAPAAPAGAVVDTPVPPAPPTLAEGADVEPTPPFTQAPAAPAASEPNAFVPPVASTPQPAAGAVTPSGLLAPLEGTTQRSTQAIIAENLPIPPELGQPPVLPADFTTLHDGQVAQLQSQFNACLARAHYLCAVAEGHGADAKIVADGLLREYKAANPVPKGTTVDQHEAQAHAANPQISQARLVQNEWNGHARQLRALADTYQWNCERLSREQTRRSDERKVA